MVQFNNREAIRISRAPTLGEPLDRPVRLMMYSHDSWGLGHLRRSLTIAGAVTERFEQADVLIVTGSPCATQFELPCRVDVLKLPAVSKSAQGQYISRHWPGRLADTLELRSRLILESYRAFDPHLVIVDHQLTGLHGEALPMLRAARGSGKILIYGMRDILDAPERVTRQWDSAAHNWALQECYDLICVYGTPEVFDPREAYPELGAHRDRVVFTGYVTSTMPRARWSAIPSFQKKVVVTMGGGEDGAERIAAYIEALALSPPDWTTHIVSGPLMPPCLASDLRQDIESRGLGELVEISQFSTNMKRQMYDADAIVSMAGYNTCAEIMQCGVPAVLLPRNTPRLEQLLRARKLESLGLARCITDLSPVLIRQAVEEALARGRPTSQTLPLDGLDSMCRLLGPLFERAGHSFEPRPAVVEAR